jgi:hypothetical protein
MDYQTESPEKKFLGFFVLTRVQNSYYIITAGNFVENLVKNLLTSPEKSYYIIKGAPESQNSNFKSLRKLRKWIG